MLAVAIRAGGRVRVAFAQGVGVDAGVELPGDLFMAFCAGSSDVELVHPCAGGHRAVHFMSAVAIDAVGRFDVAGNQCRTVHALVERAYEFHSAQCMASDVFLSNVARLTLLGLIKFLSECELRRGDRYNWLTMACEAIGRVVFFGRKSMTVRRRCETIAGRGVASSACIGLRTVIEWKRCALYRCDGVCPVALTARGIFVGGCR